MAVSNESPPPPTHILYHFYFSICALYVRYAFALRGKAKDGMPEFHIEERHIDLRPPDFDQLEEWFLCEMNPSGEIPILVTREDGNVLPDSRTIIYKMAETYPNLLPAEHESEIKRLSDELHKVEYYALTFTGKYHFPTHTIAKLLERMNEPDTSERYYKAIEYKIGCITRREIPGLMKNSFVDAVAQTKKVFQEVERLLSKTSTDWILSTAQPTALDAQVIVFVSRLQDCARDELIPERVKSYAAKAFARKEWKETMQDRQTIPPGGF